MEKENTHIISLDLAGKRFDEVAATIFELSKSQAKKLIEEGAIVLNGSVRPAKTVAAKGDSVTLTLPETHSDFEVPILYMDSDILVVDKPAGLTVHPASGEKDITLTEIIAESLEKEALVVHRLDKGTSGVMVLALNEKAKKGLQTQFQNRTVEKVYLALAEGKLEPKTGTIDIPLERGELSRGKIEPGVSGKESVTEYEVLKYFENKTYLKLRPKTGRTHQIRVHLSAIGFPIVGDVRYGKGFEGRIFLHAHSILFNHPITKEAMTLESPLPPELETVLQKIA